MGESVPIKHGPRRGFESYPPMPSRWGVYLYQGAICSYLAPYPYLAQGITDSMIGFLYTATRG